jgi:hypothetical protein
MTRIGILLAAGVLVCGSVCQAQEMHPMPAPAPYVVTATPASCCGAGGCGCDTKRSFLEWLFYRPLTRPGLCGCCKQPAPGRPPLYTWFVDYCYVGGGAAHPIRFPAAIQPYDCACPR